MKNTLIVFGSTTGNCEDYAHRIAKQLGVADIKNIADMTAADFDNYDNLILGTSTWGAGDVQDDWYSGIELLKKLDMSNRTVALFGCGESGSFPDTFCGGMSALYEAVAEQGAHLIGQVDASTYDYADSASVVDGKFVGLAIDIDEDDDKINDRIAQWTGQIASLL